MGGWSLPATVQLEVRGTGGGLEFACDSTVRGKRH